MSAKEHGINEDLVIWTVDKKIREWLPKLQSHRGLWVKDYSQNSLASIAAAYECGYEMAEFDVRITRDEVVVLFHDDNFKNKLIKNLSYSELNSLTPVTTLEELFKWFSKTEKFKLNIEVKSRDITNSKLERSISQLIKKFQIERRVLVSSFNPISLFKMRIMVPSVYRALLLTLEISNDSNFVIRSGMLNFFCRPHMLNLRYQDYSERFKKLAQKIPIVLWTVNDLTLYQNLKNEIHGIISDSITPDELRKI